MAWTSTASTELDLPNGAKVYEGTFDAICGNFGHIGGTTGLDWIDWTPTIDQGGAVAVTVNEAAYMKVRNGAIVQGLVTVTGAGTSGNAIKIQGFPAAVAPASSTLLFRTLGSCIVLDFGANQYVGAVYIPASATTALQMYTNGTNAPLGAGAFSLAAGDTIGFTAILRST